MSRLAASFRTGLSGTNVRSFTQVSCNGPGAHVAAQSLHNARSTPSLPVAGRFSSEIRQATE